MAAGQHVSDDENGSRQSINGDTGKATGRGIFEAIQGQPKQEETATVTID